jgi:aryl-alcohol dehydrogenase-like predicted oxidoreductase
MKFNKLGNSDIEVSLLCLGTMTWGQQNTQEEAHQQLDYALERGINFFDTAEMYPVPPKKETYSLTEKIIGQWDKLHTQRDKIILATKAAGPGMDYINTDGRPFKKENLVKSLTQSLERLKTDYVDLYQLHWPERQTNFFGQRGYSGGVNNDFTPFEEVLTTLSELIKEGKIRAIGLSNETPWGLSQFLKISQSMDLPRVVSVQNPYNLLNRTYETGMSEMSLRENCGLLAYSPMAFGILSGKYLGGARPEGARITLFERFSRYLGYKPEAATERYVELAKEFGLSPAQMSLAFVSSRDFLTSNIIGATNMDQLKENIDSADIELSSELLDKIDLIHQELPNPCP